MCSAGLYGLISSVRALRHHSSLPRLAIAVSEKHVIKQVTICNSNMFMKKKMIIQFDRKPVFSPKYLPLFLSHCDVEVKPLLPVADFMLSLPNERQDAA